MASQHKSALSLGSGGMLLATRPGSSNCSLSLLTPHCAQRKISDRRGWATVTRCIFGARAASWRARHAQHRFHGTCSSVPQRHSLAAAARRSRLANAGTALLSLGAAMLRTGDYQHVAWWTSMSAPCIAASPPPEHGWVRRWCVCGASANA